MNERLDRIELILENSIKNINLMIKENMERAELSEKRSKDADKRIEKLEKMLNGMGLTQGAITEDLIAENFENVFTEVGEEISSVERNLKIYSGKRIKGEFDIIGVNGTKVFVGETKTKLTKKHIDKLVDTTIPNFKKYDNRHSGMKVYGVVGARVFATEEVKEYAIEKGLYVIKEDHKGNAKILKKSLKNIKSF